MKVLIFIVLLMNAMIRFNFGLMEFGIKMAVIGTMVRMIYMVSLHFALFGEHVLDLKLKKRKVNVIIISSTLVDGIYRAI